MLIRSALGAADKRRIQAMLFANNGGSGLRQALLDGAPFLAELTHSLVLARGAGSPSFTRATTETGQKWDEAGYLDFTALAGEMVFKGARREYNQWTTSSISLASGANKSLTLTAGTYQFSMGAGTGTATFSGTGGATGSLGASASGRVSVAKTITAGTFVVTASVADLADLQVCDITGETDQTTIRPYVSVGVESAPAYHGSMVDGVKCFPTDRSGNPISTSGSYPLVGYEPWEARTNRKLQSNAFTTNGSGTPWGVYGTPSATQNLTGPDGTTSGWTLTDNAAGSTEAIWQVVTLTAAFWTDSIFVKKTTGAQASYPVFSADNGTLISAVTIDTSNGVATSWTGYTGLTIATGSTARITSWNADWWRVENIFTGTAATWNFVYHTAGTTNPTQSTGVFDTTAQGAMGIAFSQTELGSFATPYIPTTTAAVARNADLLTYTGADVANIKTLAATFSRGVGIASNGVIVALDNGTANVFSLMNLTNATTLQFTGAVPATQWVQNATNAYAPGATSKVATSMVANSILMDKDGVAQTPDVSATLPAVTQLDVGHVAGLLVLNGSVNHIYGWTRNLSQSELGAVDR